MNRLEAMTTLMAAVDAGSLSAASRQLGVPLATVSRRVSDLETYLRAKLLIRTSRRLELTDAGRCYVAACREILEQVDYAERLASGEYAAPKGDIVVTAPIVFGRLHVLPVVTEFLDAYPDINVRLVQTDRVTNFMEDHVDVALRIGRLPDSGLVASRVGDVRCVVCASPNYQDRKGSAPLGHPQDLRHHPCITFEGLFSADRWTFQENGRATTVPIRSRLVVTTIETAIDAAISGLGVARVLSYQIAKAVKDGTLEVILDEFEPDPWPVSIVHSGQGLMPLKVRAFIDFAKERLRHRLAAASDL